MVDLRSLLDTHAADVAKARAGTGEAHPIPLKIYFLSALESAGSPFS